MTHNVRIIYDPKNNKSTYMVDKKCFYGKFWDEAGFVKGAFEPFYAFLKEAGIPQGEIDEIKPNLEDGGLTLVDVTNSFFGEGSTTFVSNLFERC